MPEVLNSDLKFKRAKGNTDGSKQPAASNRRSGVTSERVALLVLSVLLVAYLGLTLYENIQIKKSLQKVQEECEAKHLSEETCPRCEDCWEPHGGKSYFFSSDKLAWNESRTQCKSRRGDLVVINNKDEQKFLHSRLRKKMDKPEDKFWIGLTDSKNEGKWLWVDNTRLDPSLTFWHPKEPDNSTGENPDGEDCVRMVWEKNRPKDLKIWFDKSCDSSQKYICEKPEEA